MKFHLTWHDVAVSISIEDRFIVYEKVVKNIKAFSPRTTVCYFSIPSPSNGVIKFFFGGADDEVEKARTWVTNESDNPANTSSIPKKKEKKKRTGIIISKYKTARRSIKNLDIVHFSSFTSLDRSLSKFYLRFTLHFFINMTCHTVNFDLGDLRTEKRTQPILAISSPTPLIESFGWGDFPIMTVLQNSPFVFEKPTVVDASDITASTVELEYEDDSLPDSELEEEETNLLAADTSETLTKPIRQVSFGEVEVREYVVVLGVHPLATGGYPMELGWDYNIHSAQPLDSLEQQRTRVGLKRLSYIERHFRLAEMCGGNLCQILNEEKRRRKALELEMAAARPAEDEETNGVQVHGYSSGFTKHRMMRSSSHTSLLRCV